MNDDDKSTLLLDQKICDLIEYSLIAFRNFPKSERFSLVADIKDMEYTLLFLCIAAEKKYTKKTTLQEMDITVAKLRRFIRMSYNLQFISIHTYEVWSGKVVEIGKMLGGWIKTVNDQPHQHRG